MQYFKPELLKSETDIEWENNGKAYRKKFLRCSKYLPLNLVKILEVDAFHDATIQTITFEKTLYEGEFKFNIIMELRYKGQIGKLIHYGVQEFRSTLNNLGSYIDFGDYLYGEILQDKNKFWTHDFLLFGDSEINIKCEKIEWLDQE